VRHNRTNTIPDQKPRAEVRDQKKRGVEFLGHRKVKAAK